MTEIAFYPRPAVLDTFPSTGPVLLEASAGTGKTWMLERLVIEGLVRRRLDLDSILLLTFTEKATIEMTQRVRSLIRQLVDHRGGEDQGEGSWRIDDEVRSHLRRQLERFSSAPIQTLHAFCQQLLSQSAFDSGRLLQQDTRHAERLRAELFVPWMRRRLAAGDDTARACEAWLADGRGLSQLDQEIRRALDPRTRVVTDWDSGAQEAFWDQLSALDFDAVIASFSGDVNIHGRSVEKVLRTLRGWGDILQEWPGHRDPWRLLARMGDLQNQAEYLCGLKYTKGRAGQRRLPDDHTPEAREFLASLFEWSRKPADLKSVVTREVSEAFRDHLDHMKISRGVIDFDDMVRHAAGRIREDAALTQRLQERYTWALVDEFQDTDSAQWDMLSTLFMGTSARLILIGDPKQAIYSFRGADILTYVRARQEVTVAGGAVVPLHVNWRSAPSLIESLNALLDQERATPFFTGSEIRYEPPVTCGAPDIGMASTGSAVRYLGLHGDHPQSATRLMDQLAERLVDEIEALLDEKPLVVDAAGGAPRPLEPRDIMVLTRTSGEMARLSRRFTHAGLALSRTSREGLYSTPEARDLLTWLSWLCRPRDRSLRRQVLASPLFDVPMSRVLGMDVLEAGSPYQAILGEWMSLAREERLGELLESWTVRSGFSRRAVASLDGERSLVNARHLIEILQRRVLDDGLGLVEIRDELDALVSGVRGEDDQTLQRLETDRSALRLMTMHKCKGLEAHVVFLAGGFSKGFRAGPVIRRRDGRQELLYQADDETRAAALQEDRQEAARLLYVAMTRAKSRLYLPWVPENLRSSGFRYSTMAVLMDHLEATPPILEPARPQAPPRKTLSLSVPKAATLPEDVSPARDYDDLQRSARSPRVLSYTRLSRRASEASLRERAEVHAEMSPGPRGRVFGICLHAILEHVDFSEITGRGPGDWGGQAREQARQQCHCHGFDEDDSQVALSLVHQSLASPVDLPGLSLPKGFRQLGDLRRELEFLFPRPGSRDEFRGFVDLAFRWEGATWFLDWKSDSVSLEQLETHTRDHYSTQGDLYLMALQRWARQANARVGGMIYAYLRHPGSPGLVVRQPDSEELVALERKWAGGAL